MKTCTNKQYARSSTKYTSFNEILRKEIEKLSPTVTYNGGYEEYEDSNDYIRIKAVLLR